MFLMCQRDVCQCEKEQKKDQMWKRQTFQGVDHESDGKLYRLHRDKENRDWIIGVHPIPVVGRRKD